MSKLPLLQGNDSNISFYIVKFMAVNLENILMLQFYKKNSFSETYLLFVYTIKWLFIASLIGILAGSASAFFLISLDWVTNWRENHIWIISMLPIAGFLIGLMYHFLGKNVVKGNNQLIEEIQNPKKIIPLIMVPLVYVGTLLTHLFGGSAGREGTAVQMGGAFADQLTKIFRLRPRDRKILIICGISAGFSSVFGTPLAGAVFGLEVFIIGSMVYGAIMPSFLAAIVADMVCKAWGVGHMHYSIDLVPEISAFTIAFALLAGIIFGLTSRVFSNLNLIITNLFKAKVSYPPLRPLIGGVLIVLIIWLIGNTRYIGLGIPVILESFNHPQLWYIFLIKIFLTALTLGSGFKGGEVTPLFFIGATLGSFLSLIFPLPVALLAGMGFAAVFAGAANTPIACILMGMELFGIESGIYLAIACVVAYLFSGHNGIYHSQIIGHSKHLLLSREQGQSLSIIRNKRKSF